MRDNDNRTLKIELLSHWKLEAEFRKNNGPFCSACMCLPHCREPTQLHARPQPSFQISVTDPAEQKISGEVHIYKVKLVPQQVQCLLKQKVTSMHLLM